MDKAKEEARQPSRAEAWIMAVLVLFAGTLYVAGHWVIGQHKAREQDWCVLAVAVAVGYLWGWATRPWPKGSR